MPDNLHRQKMEEPILGCILNFHMTEWNVIKFTDKLTCIKFNLILVYFYGDGLMYG